jgi:hypothetical protein
MSERDELFARAKEIGLKVPGNLGTEKLKAAIEDKEAELNSETVTVVGPPKGRRRIGRRFGPEPVEIKMTDLSDGDLETLRSDPTLSVSVS